MTDAHFAFDTTAFNDSDDVRAQNINGIAGHSLATWLVQRLKSQGYKTSEIWDEDHGWDFYIYRGEATYLCACSIAEDDRPPHEGHVSLEKLRTLMDKLKRRNKYASTDDVVTDIASLLRSSDDVGNLSSET